MKTLLGISTLNRDTAPNVFNPVASLFDKIFVVVQGECGEWQIADGSVYNKLDWVIQAPGLAASRNRIFQYALDNGYDYVVQSDDDLKVSPVAAEKMLELLYSLPYVGSVTAPMDLSWVWTERRITSSNSQWILRKCPCAFWGTSIAVVREVGMPFTKTETWDDHITGLELWQLGRPSISANSDRKYTIVHLIPFDSEKPKPGGQPIEEKINARDAAVAYAKEHISPDILKMVAPSLKKRYYIDYRCNWKEMTARVTARWGDLGYSDSKGRKM